MTGMSEEIGVFTTRFHQLVEWWGECAYSAARLRPLGEVAVAQVVAHPPALLEERWFVHRTCCTIASAGPTAGTWVEFLHNGGWSLRSINLYRTRQEAVRAAALAALTGE